MEITSIPSDRNGDCKNTSSRSMANGSNTFKVTLCTA